MATKKKTATVQTKEEKTSTSQPTRISKGQDSSKKTNSSSDTRKKRTTSASGKQSVRKKECFLRYGIKQKTAF